MRPLLLFVPCLTLILVAGLPDVRWLVAPLGCAAVWLLWRLSEREREVEQNSLREAIWSDIIDVVSSAEQKPEAPHADQD
jgi:hypothetical protein